MSVIGDLSSQTLKLQQCLDSNSPLYADISSTILKIWEPSEPNEIIHLTKLYQLLNNTENIATFNQIKKRRLIEEINTSILTLIQENISRAYNVPIPIRASRNNNNSTSWKTGLFFLAASLISIFVAIDGASIVQAILSTFGSVASIPNIIIIPAQIFFATIAVFTFCALELNAIGKPLGIRAFDLGRVFKLYTKQSRLFESVFSMMQEAIIHHNLNNEQIDNLNNDFQLLNRCYGNFENKVNEARLAQANPTLLKKIVINSCTGVAAFVCGILGAMMAQSTMTSALPIILGASAAAGPLGIGITAGVMLACFCAAALFYITIERKAVTEFVNKVWGTPTKSVIKLIEHDRITKNTLRNIPPLLNRGRGKAPETKTKEIAIRPFSTLRSHDQKAFLAWQSSKKVETETTTSSHPNGMQNELRSRRPINLEQQMNSVPISSIGIKAN